ncbi:MAG TPA: hypothetical protein VH741_04060 [Candidatus Limnocylindrales bacterium]
MDLAGSSGSTGVGPSFFSRTTERPAARRAAARQHHPPLAGQQRLGIGRQRPDELLGLLGGIGHPTARHELLRLHECGPGLGGAALAGEIPPEGREGQP